MNAPTRYIINTATPVECGGGRVWYIRETEPAGWLLKIGAIPSSFSNTIAAQNSQTRKAEADAFIRDNPEYAVKFTNALLVLSVVAVAGPNEAGEIVTEPITLTELPQGQAKAGELSVDMLIDEDREAITTAAMELNGLSTEAAERHRPFFRGLRLALWLAGLGAGVERERLETAQDAAHGAREGASGSDRPATEAAH